MRLWTVLFLLSILVAVPVSADYAIWIADAQRGIIKMYSDDNGVEYLGRNAMIVHPTSVIVDSKGRIWAADRSGVVYQLDPNTFDEEFSMEGFGLVTKFVADPIDDTILMLDQGRNEIAKVTPDAVVLWRTRLGTPLSLDINLANGDIWVGSKDKIYLLDNTGNIIKEIPGMVNRAEDIKVDPVTNEVWIADVWHSQVLHINKEGIILSRTSVRSPKQIALNIPFGGVAVLDKLNRQIHFIDEKGVLFRTISEGIDNPWTIAIDPQQGNLWLATNTNSIATLKRYSTDGGVLLYNMEGFFTPTDLAFDFSDSSTTSNRYFPTTKDLERPQNPSKISTPLFEPVTITEDKDQGDKGLWRGSLREYLKTPANLAYFKSYDKRISGMQAHAQPKTVSAMLYSYCEQLLKNGRDPFKYAPYQQYVREQVLLVDCAERYEILGFYGGFIPYTEPAINMLTLSPIPSVDEIQAQSRAPYQEKRGESI